MEGNEKAVADDNGTSTFLNLPAEIRNLVYSELLTLRNHNGATQGITCWPQILATSKQIHTEARGILYGNNEAEVEFVVVHGSARNPQNSREYMQNFAVKINNGPAIHIYDPYVRDTFSAWPHWLCKFQHVRLLITVDQGGAAVISHQYQLFKAVNHHIYSLCCFLARENSLQGFKVILDQGPTAAMWFPKKTIWPLLKLGDPKVLHFCGVSEDVVAYLNDRTRWPSSQAFDTFGLARAAGKPPPRASFGWKRRSTRPIDVSLHATDYIDHAYEERLVAKVMAYQTAAELPAERERKDGRDVYDYNDYENMRKALSNLRIDNEKEKIEGGGIANEENVNEKSAIKKRGRTKNGKRNSAKRKKGKSKRGEQN